VTRFHIVNTICKENTYAKLTASLLYKNVFRSPSGIAWPSPGHRLAITWFTVFGVIIKAVLTIILAFIS